MSPDISCGANSHDTFWDLEPSFDFPVPEALFQATHSPYGLSLPKQFRCPSGASCHPPLSSDAPLQKLRLADVTGDIFYSLLILFQEPQTLRICQGSNLQDPFTQTTPKVSFQITAHATPPESVQLPPEFSVNSACSSRVLTTSTVGGRTCSSILFFVGGKLAGHRFLIDATTSKNQRQPLDIARVGSGASQSVSCH